VQITLGNVTPISSLRQSGYSETPGGAPSTQVLEWISERNVVFVPVGRSACRRPLRRFFGASRIS